jgi:hypothetical protein
MPSILTFRKARLKMKATVRDGLRSVRTHAAEGTKSTSLVLGNWYTIDHRDLKMWRQCENGRRYSMKHEAIVIFGMLTLEPRL